MKVGLVLGAGGVMGASWLVGALEALSKGGSFVGQHICVPLEGAAVHINAFNFPVWGMLEKLAPTLLAGVPAIVKPATATAYLTEQVFRRIVGRGIVRALVTRLLRRRSSRKIVPEAVQLHRLCMVRKADLD